MGIGDLANDHFGFVLCPVQPAGVDRIAGLISGERSLFVGGRLITEVGMRHIPFDLSHFEPARHSAVHSSLEHHQGAPSA